MKATIKKLVIDTPYVNGERHNFRPTAVLKAFIRPEEPLDKIRVFWGKKGCNIKEIL